MPGNGAAAGASYGDLLVTSLLVLGAVCIAAFVAVRVFGRLLATGRVKGAHLLEVVARVPLEPRRSLYVVEVAGKTLLVGTSEMGLSVLSELDAHEVKSRVVAQPSFADLVRGAWNRRKGRASPEATASPDAAARTASPDAAAEIASPGAARPPSPDAAAPKTSRDAVATAAAADADTRTALGDAAATTGAAAKQSKPASDSSDT